MSHAVSAKIRNKSKVTKEEWREFTKTVWAIANTTHPSHPAVFPVEIPHRLIKLFSFHGEVILDPFAGTGSTAVAALRLGRRAVCVDQNPEYVRVLKERCRLEVENSPALPALRAESGDSADLQWIENDSVGLIVTSPPYWDKAEYGGNGANIGRVSSYRQFLDSIRPIFEECWRVLMPGRKICIVTANVNQHTDHGLLTFPLASDFTLLLRELGFVMVNEIIWSKDRTGGRWGSFGHQRPIFGSYPYPPNFLFKNIHEYILIFSKPRMEKTRGPKVREYAELMSDNASSELGRKPAPHESNRRNTTGALRRGDGVRRRRKSK